MSTALLWPDLVQNGTNTRLATFTDSKYPDRNIDNRGGGGTSGMYPQTRMVAVGGFDFIPLFAYYYYYYYYYYLFMPKIQYTSQARWA